MNMKNLNGHKLTKERKKTEKEIRQIPIREQKNQN